MKSLTMQHYFRKCYGEECIASRITNSMVWFAHKKNNNMFVDVVVGILCQVLVFVIEF